MWRYTLGCLVLWVLNPELRRLYDLYFGFSQVQFIAVLPLLSLTPHAWQLLFRGGWRRLPRMLAIAAWVWIGAFAYGLVTAFLSGNVLPGVYEFITFIYPLGIGLWVAADDAPFVLAYKRLTSVIFALATFTSIYGIYQYVIAPPWDCYWLKEVIATGSTSFGRPAPFEIRVWSTLNDPGSFSLFLAVALLFVLPELTLRRPLLLLQVPFWFIAFGLTLVRTGWLMFAIGTAFYLVLSPGRAKVLVTFSIAAAMIVGIVAVLPAVIGNDTMLTSLITRFSTLQNLDEDESRQERQALYSYAPQIILGAPFGAGLGIVGGATRLGSSGTTTDFDSGWLARSLEMGLPGLALYIVPQVLLFGTAFQVWLRGRSEKDTVMQSVAAIAAAHFAAFVLLEFAHDANGLPTMAFWLIESLSLSAFHRGTAGRLKFSYA